jgi:hypothetical protein
METDALSGALSNMRWTLRETAALVSVDWEVVGPAKLNELVRQGFIRPLLMGRRGRGFHTQFDLKQVIGISAAVHLWLSPRGCFWAYVAETVREFESWDWGAVKHLLGLQPDFYTQEAYAQAVKERMDPEEFDQVESFVHPEDRKRGKLLYERLMRIRTSVVRQLQLEERRHRNLGGRRRGRAQKGSGLI